MATTRKTDDALVWTGTHVQGSTACAVVKYHGPTNTRGSRWIATIRRGGGETWRASVPFSDGPIAAAVKAAHACSGCDWEPISCNSIDVDTYCVGF